jgi:hypothetical protein
MTKRLILSFCGVALLALTLSGCCWDDYGHGHGYGGHDGHGGHHGEH